MTLTPKTDPPPHPTIPLFRSFISKKTGFTIVNLENTTCFSDFFGGGIFPCIRGGGIITNIFVHDVILPNSPICVKSKLNTIENFGFKTQFRCGIF